MSERHLQKGIFKCETCEGSNNNDGSPLPDVNPEVIRLYIMRFCPYAERVRLVLNHKQLPFEEVCVNLVNKPEWLFERNPDGTVPVLEYKGHCMSETAVCDEYLEDAFPNSGPHPLMPSLPFEKAAARLFMRRFDGKKNVVMVLKSKTADAENFQKILDEHLSGIQDLEKHLARSGENFFSGKQVGLIDFHLWPFFERAPAIGEILHVDLYPDEKYPQLNKWIRSMEENDAVKKVRLPNELHRRFLVSFLEGNPQYDMELN